MKRMLKIILLAVPVLCLVSLAWRYAPFFLRPSPHKTYYPDSVYREELHALNDSLGHASLRRRSLLLHSAVSERIFPFWEGTPWDFNGTTERPGNGKIACGYFVTTVLRDLGFVTQRKELACMASEQMIRDLVAEKNIRRYSRFTLTDFLKDVRKKGNQLYVVGLDNHTGFLSCENGQCWFIHASGGYRRCVIKEKAETSSALAFSSYRVTGCLTSDSLFLAGWKK
ncbi:MAG TPA: hypothetical protein VFU15_12455 [Bacteroidia bacterium]|nr:hypothetical protein [Bacteroidia bacterium]